MVWNAGAADWRRKAAWLKKTAASAPSTATRLAHPRMRFSAITRSANQDDQSRHHQDDLGGKNGKVRESEKS